MKKLLLTACMLGLVQLLNAQNTAGTITYTETVKMNIDLGGDVDINSGGDVNAEQIRNMIPKEQHMKKVLYYNEEAALYLNDKKKEQETNDFEHNDGNMRVVFKVARPEDIVYTSLKEAKLIEQRDFMGRKFLITSAIDKPKWKMTGGQKSILGYPCQEAVMQKDKDTITAWFTAAIPVSAGPQGFSGLPGMILEAKQNSQLTLKADEVVFGTGNDKLIVKPKGGKKVTKEEYEKIVAEKQKEMEENGGNDKVIIKVGR
jgi:GLPGLI family protein